MAVGAGTIQGIGAAASAFAEGYRQAHQQKFQKTQAINEAQFEHAKGLLQAADQIQDPTMAETVRKQAMDLMNQYSPNGSKSSGKSDDGIGHAIGRLFGFGKTGASKGQVPADTISDAPAGPPMPTAPPAVSADSRTFGDLDSMFGSTLNAPSATPSASSPKAGSLPAVPSPSFENASGEPVPSSAAGGTPAQPAALVPGPSSVEAFALPSPIELTLKYRSANSGPMGTVTAQSLQKAQLQAQQEAEAHSRVALTAIDHIIQQDPGRFATLGQAENDKEHGQDFRTVMSGVQAYEDAGQLPKGTVESWQKQRFNDVRFGSDKMNTSPVVTPEGTYAFNPATGKHDLQIGSPSYENKLNAIYSKPPETWTPDEKNTVAGSIAQIRAKEDAGHPATTKESLEKDYAAELAKNIFNGPARKRMEDFTKTTAPPVQPPSMIMGPQAVTATGEIHPTMINPKDGTLRTLDVALPVHYDYNRIMRTEKNVQVPSKQFPDRPDYKDIQVFDPEQVKQAFRNGELGGIKALQDIVASGQFANADDTANLTRFLQQVKAGPPPN